MELIINILRLVLLMEELINLEEISGHDYLKEKEGIFFNEIIIVFAHIIIIFI